VSANPNRKDAARTQSQYFSMMAADTPSWRETILAIADEGSRVRKGVDREEVLIKTIEINGGLWVA